MWPFGRSGADGSSTPATIDVHEAFARAGRGARLIDVRSEREFAAGHVKGARNVPPAQLHNGAGGLRPDDEILLICASGHRSLREARSLAKRGYTKVFNVGGGTVAWQRAGLPMKTRRR
jgi:rhodanese-related sulfurtransferase